MEDDRPQKDTRFMADEDGSGAKFKGGNLSEQRRVDNIKIKKAINRDENIAKQTEKQRLESFQAYKKSLEENGDPLFG